MAAHDLPAAERERTPPANDKRRTQAKARRRSELGQRNEWIRAGEQPGGQDLSKWGRNGRIEAQRALAAAQVTPMATQKEAGRGKSI